MKIIDLLNKMANGEEVPEKIKHQYYDYEWNTIDKDYQTRDGEMLLGNMNIQYHLNDEIILIEDEIDIDNIEELDTYETVETYDWQDVDTNRMTINELVQAVKQLNKEIKSIKEK